MAKARDLKTKAIGGLGKSLSATQHERLLKYIRARLDVAAKDRDAHLHRFEQVDKDIAGYITPNADDKQRIKDNREGKGPKAVDVNLQLTYAQLDEATTYILSVITDDTRMYSAIAEPSKQNVAQAFTATMNRHARYFKHFRQMAKSVFDGLKYNFGGLLTEWETVHGNIVTDAGGTAQIERNALVMEGNRIEAIDPYNFLYDTACDVVELSTKGEFFAMVEKQTSFRLRYMRNAGEVFFDDNDLVGNDGLAPADSASYFAPHPAINPMYFEPSAAKGTNWDSFVSARSGEARTLDRNELVHYYGWIPAHEFGLEPKTRDPEAPMNFSIWRFTVLNGIRIVAATKLDNAHGKLPIALTMPSADGILDGQASYSDALMKLQYFASSIMNMHIRASRKRLYGLTIYNPKVVPLLDIGNLEGGTVAAKPTTLPDVNLRNAIMQFNDAPDTSNTMRDIDSAMGLMQRILPTDIQNNVAGLDRATMYQAASVVHGTNRRNLKIAKMVYDQMVAPCQEMQAYNIFQYMRAIEFVDEATGEEIEANPAEFRSTKIEFAISDGLKGIDRMLIAEGMRETIHMLIQSKAGEQFDIAQVINYYTSLSGDRTDFNQFRIKSQIDALPPDQKNLAFQLLQEYMMQQEQAQTQGGALSPPQMPGVMG